MSSETIVFIGSDGKTIEVDEIVAIECDYINNLFKVEENIDETERWHIACLKKNRRHIRFVTSTILSMVFDYCKKHVDKTISDKDLKAFDSEFVKVDNDTLLLLIIAAETMTINNLLDLTLQAAVNIFSDMTPEEIYTTLGICNDFTAKEVKELYITHAWAFQERKYKNEEFARLTKKEQNEKRIMDKKSFLPKVLPILTSTEFAYLTPEEKREWVLVAVLIPHVRKILALARYEYDPRDKDDEEREMANLEEKAVGQEESQKIVFDLTDLFVDELKDENLVVKNRVFQLFSVRVYHQINKEGRLYGLIEAKGHGSTEVVSLFNRGEDASESQPIYNNGYLYLTDPSPYQLISATGTINMEVQLFVCIDGKELKLGLTELFWDCTRPEYNACFNHFQTTMINEYEGGVKLYYIVLDDAIEATMEVSFQTPNSFHVAGHIVAYYGDLESYIVPPNVIFPTGSSGELPTSPCGPYDIEWCKAILFATDDSPVPYLLENGKISLRRSKLVVPNGGSLLIEVRLSEVKTSREIISGTLKFDSKVENSNQHIISGSDCSMCVNVDWKYQEEEEAKKGIL